MIRLSNMAAALCERLGEFFYDLATHLKRCPDCRQLTYRSKPCK